MRLIRVLSALGVFICFVLWVSSALASRNASGTMSGINGPYVAGTTISSSVINARFADIETEITDSLNRSGKGPMLAPMRLTNGTSSAPSLTFDSETTAGLYRVSSGIVAMTYNATESCRWTTNGIRCADGAVATPSLSFSNDTGSGLYRIGSNNIGFAINGTKRQEWTTTGTIVGGTTTLGASGTAISQSGRGTASLTPAAINSQQCQTQSITIAGATAGTECAAGIPSGGLGALSFTCNITSATACTLYLCNPTTGSVTPPAGTYTCRYFNP